MEVKEDRRRHRRFDTNAFAAALAMICSDEQKLELASCSLLNVSYGGMCFRTGFLLEPDAEYRFLVDVRAPLGDLVVVKARIRWIRERDTGERLAGAEFVESSKGWFGPDDE